MGSRQTRYLLCVKNEAMQNCAEKKKSRASRINEIKWHFRNTSIDKFN